MSYNDLYFSKYAHHFVQDHVVAIFHSLKLKPLFMELCLFNELNNIITSDIKYSDDDLHKIDNGDKILEAISLLKDIRVLNETVGRDDEVIKFFRDSLGTPQIKIAYFILSESCNLACSYCFENAPPLDPTKVDDSPRIMSELTGFQCLDFFERMISFDPNGKEEKDIIFYGGEPLLNYSVLIYLLKEIAKRKNNNTAWQGVRLSLVTNGTLLTPEKAMELSQLGLSIGISVDGPKDINDANRFNHKGGSVFDSIINGIESCKKADIEFSLSVTLSEISVRNYNKVMSFIKSIKPSSLGFNLLLTNKTFSAYRGYNEDAADFLIKAFKEFREEGLYEDRMMRKVNAFVNSEVYPFDCGASGGSQVVFSPDGRVGICHGYLQDKKFFPTHVSSKDFLPESDSVFMEWAKRTPLNMEQCQDCPALGICGGGCPMNAEKNHGSIWDLDDRFCVHAKRTFEWLIWDLYQKMNEY
jgi:uncharacterized protein